MSRICLGNGRLTVLGKDSIFGDGVFVENKVEEIYIQI
jgi:hypothetical protein